MEFGLAVSELAAAEFTRPPARWKAARIVLGNSALIHAVANRQPEEQHGASSCCGSFMEFEQRIEATAVREQHHSVIEILTEFVWLHSVERGAVGPEHLAPI